MSRALYTIAEEIRKDWPRMSPYAQPYWNAMQDLATMQDTYGADDARGVVAYFLANAQTWKGDTARRVKAELNTMLKEARNARA